MNELSKLLQENLNIEFISATLSNPKNKDGVQKVKVRPILKKDVLYFQFESFRNNQAFHENVEEKKACEILLKYMENMRQMQMETQRAAYTILVSKKGKVTIKSKMKKGEKKQINMSHDRKKKYVLEEGVPVPFLQDLGVMTQDGKIVHAKFDKFRQINRFLEFIEDILPELDKGRELTILDFGCGKSYLTFAMYYYLHELKEYDIRIIGLDLKKDVIRHCNELSEKYGYEKLRFLEGDIADYTGVNKVDMEHTPKNILIRAVKKRHAKEDNNVEASIKRCEAALRVSPTLGRLLDGFATESANSEKDHPEKEDKEGV